MSNSHPGWSAPAHQTPFSAPGSASRLVFQVSPPGPADPERQGSWPVLAIRQPGGRGDGAALAYVYQSPASPVPQNPGTGSSAALWIHGGSDGGPLCVVRPVGRAEYEVHTPEGAPLARVSRRPGRVLPWPRRTRWTIRPADGSPPAVGKAGSWYAWTFYLLLAPIWFPLWLVQLVYSLVGGSDPVDLDGPRRTRWRTAGAGTALDRRGISTAVYDLDPRRLDVRIAYAQAVLRSGSHLPPS
ncbi:hypothetical protein ACFWVC_33790 [Streptomyces sp. NPDC058691]|uniref:hypothetical protein n=1 Tax=Streptomyces sp. NPDC058691 TaxID=3346601 RepID=UPI0036542D3D